MLLRQRMKTEVFQRRSGPKYFERLREAAASKLCIWHAHRAGGGSLYVTINDLWTLRVADHENTSAHHRDPDFNFVNRTPTEDELQEIVSLIRYPRLCKKTAFAKHVGLTVPKLKKHLTPECLEDACENEAYPNTTTEYVVVDIALKTLSAAGVTERIPVCQEVYTIETFSRF